MLTVSLAVLIGTLVLNVHPVKSINHAICSWPSGRLRIAFSIRYTRCRIWFSNDVVFCNNCSSSVSLQQLYKAQICNKSYQHAYLHCWSQYKNRPPMPIMKICSVEFSSLTFNCHFTLTTQTHHIVSETLRKDLKMMFMLISKHYTQRISSGLNFDRHLSVSSTIFFDLPTFQFRASKYLLKHASVQYCKSRPESGPIAALSSLICMWNRSIKYVIIQNRYLFHAWIYV